MIYHGIDLIELPRFTQTVLRHGSHFVERVFTPQERRDAGWYLESVVTPKVIRSLAGRWAAKEATAKAIGTGLRGLGAGSELARPSFHEIEVVRLASGQPHLRLHGVAAQLAASHAIYEFALSLSHSEHYAIASVIGVG